MRATINGQTYDEDEATYLCNDPSPDGDDVLYQTKDGKFFLRAMSAFVDGKKLQPWQCPGDISPDLDNANTETPLKTIMGNRRKRLRYTQQIVPLSDREAMIWCIKTQIPECFRGYLLESI